MSEATGLSEVNSEVLSAINDMIGRVILINTTEKKRYSGVLSAVSQELAIGMQCVVEITKENENNLLRTKSDVVDKMVFNFCDIVDIVYVTQEDQKHHQISKFVTDRQYHGDGPTDCDELQEWNAGDEDCLGGAIEDDIVTVGSLTSRRNNHNGTGWSVDDMFAVNEKMNVVSTFKEDMTQYTTVEVVGTEVDRARAERFAREIESSSNSKFMANLENDDDERDLDKALRPEDFETGSNPRGGKRNNNHNQQQRRNANVTPNGQPANRRAEGLRGDRRNSGSSSANNSRFNTPNPSQNYQQQPQQQQNQKGGNYNRRQNEEYRENDWQMAKGKGQNQGHDHSFRQQQKQVLDPRPNSKPTDSEKAQVTGSRVTDLKNWRSEFPIAFPTKEQSPASGSTAPGPQGNSGSAWNRGPPSSLVSKGSSAESTPPPAENEIILKKEETPSTSGGAENEADEKQDDVPVTDAASEASSVVTTKSSFKFNINAPEFKPRVASATPTPTTQTAPIPQNPVQGQQFVSAEYQPHTGIVPPGGPQGPAIGMQGNMVSHIVPGGVPPNQGQPIMMWAQGQQGYPPNQQFPIQQVSIAGVPGQIYGSAPTAPVTVSQPIPPNHHNSTSASGGAPTDGRPGNQSGRRDGEYREAQQMYYPYNQPQQIVPVSSQQFYHPQYPSGQYPVKLLSQHNHQGHYQQRFHPPVYVVPPGQNPQQRYQGPPQQSHQFSGEQAGPLSHPNSQPTTPGPRSDLSGPKMQSGGPQNGNNGINRETEAGSNASLSGSTSSQSGQRSGSPPNNGIPTQQQQLVQGPVHSGSAHGAAPPGSMIGMPPQHMAPYLVMPSHPIHSPIPTFYTQQPLYYPMMVSQQLPMQPNQHTQQGLIGERTDQGFPATSYFDYRMPNYQPNQTSQHQQQQQMHGGHMSRQNSLPQQYGGNQGVNSSPQPAPPSSQHQQQSHAGPPQDLQPETQNPQ